MIDATNTDGGEGEGQGSEGAAKVVPLAVVEAERKKRQAVEAQLAEYQAAQAKAAEEAAAKRGEFEALYTSTKAERDALAAKAEALEAAQAARNAEQATRNDGALKQLPDGARKLIEASGVDDPWRLAAMIEAAREAAPTFAQGTRGGGGTARGTIAPPAECVAEARQLGKSSDAEIAAYFEIWRHMPAGQRWASSSAAKP
jgi:phage I-like protein